jgi:UDP-glucose 4-epimerase
MLRSLEPVINGDGLQTRDYVFVGDVVHASVLALGMQGTDTFNVCTGVETTVTDIFRDLNGGLEEPVKEVHGAAKPGEQRRSVCTYGKIEAALGWTPTVPMREGLLHTLEFFHQKIADE